jgi:hypothetical protein
MHGAPRRPAGRGPHPLLLACAAALGGCFADPTEVVVVVDTDAVGGRDFSNVAFIFSQGTDSPPPVSNGTAMPVTLGVRPSRPGQTFDVQVTLETAPVPPRFDPSGQMLPPFAIRKAAEVHFVDGEMRTLFIPIPKICACVDASGMPITSCAHALDPECKELRNPPLGEFDQDNLPRLTPLE